MSFPRFPKTRARCYPWTRASWYVARPRVISSPSSNAVSPSFSRASVLRRESAPTPPRRGRGKRPPRPEALIMTRLTLNPSSPPTPSQAAAVEGARLATLAASRANATSRGATMPPLGASGAPAAANAEYREEAAFASVHDLVHYAIISCPAQRCARRRQTSSPTSPKRAPERSCVSETAHDTNSADHRLPPLDAQGLAPSGVPHMRDPGAHRPQAYVPAALLSPRASSLFVAAPPTNASAALGGPVFPVFSTAEISPNPAKPNRARPFR